MGCDAFVQTDFGLTLGPSVLREWAGAAPVGQDTLGPSCSLGVSKEMVCKPGLYRILFKRRVVPGSQLCSASELLHSW